MTRYMGTEILELRYKPLRQIAPHERNRIVKVNLLTEVIFAKFQSNIVPSKLTTLRGMNVSKTEEKKNNCN